MARLGPRLVVAGTHSGVGKTTVATGALSDSVAAVVHGYASLDPRVRVAGVVLNRVAGAGHETLLRDALVPLGIPVLGALPPDDSLEWRDRHLGLVPVAEHAADVRASLGRLASAVERGCDVDALLALARSAPALDAGPPPSAQPSGRARVAVAGGPAFSFCYPDNLELLDQAGAEIVPFDPLHDAALPDAVDALYAGGGFPEVFVEALADNRPLLADVRERVCRGLVTWAEC